MQVQERLTTVLNMWAERKAFRRPTVELLRQAMMGEEPPPQAAPVQANQQQQQQQPGVSKCTGLCSCRVVHVCKCSGASVTVKKHMQTEAGQHCVLWP